MKSRFLPVALAAACLAPLTATATAASKPNVIVILCDDLGYGDVGVFYQNARLKNAPAGTPVIHTPCIDRMAAEGIRLDAMYCPAPVCAPSRGSLLTGTHQGHAGVRNNQFDKALEDNHTLASVLRTAGYATAVIGKWGLQGGDERNPKAGAGLPVEQRWSAYPTARGFDYFYGYVRHLDGHEHYPKHGVTKRPSEVWENTRECSADLDLCYTTDLFTARAKQWISDTRKAAPDKPFFLYLAYDTPHAATQLPPCPYPAGGGLRGGVQWTGKRGAMINTATGKPDSWTHPDYAAATFRDTSGRTKPWPELARRYATSVRRIDDAVGDILTLLRDLAIDDDTLVVFTSDNGPSDESYLKLGPNDLAFFRSYGDASGTKRDVLDGGLRVGAIVRAPGRIPAGRASGAPAQFHDFLPTFAALAGVPAPARTDGVSLLPLLTGAGAQKPSIVYSEYAYPGPNLALADFPPAQRGRMRGEMQMIRRGDLVGLRYAIRGADDAFEIYDVAKDPSQARDIAADHPALAAGFKADVLRLRRTDASARRPYDDAPIPAVTPPAGLVSGVTRRDFPGDFPWVPALDPAAAIASARVVSPGEPRAGATGASLYSGYIRVPETGDYTFTLPPGARAFLRVHDIAALDADRGGERSVTLRLQAGTHPFRLHTLAGAPATLAATGPRADVAVEWLTPAGATER